MKGAGGSPPKPPQQMRHAGCVPGGLCLSETSRIGDRHSPTRERLNASLGCRFLEEREEGSVERSGLNGKRVSCFSTYPPPPFGWQGRVEGWGVPLNPQQMRHAGCVPGGLCLSETSRIGDRHSPPKRLNASLRVSFLRRKRRGFS